MSPDSNFALLERVLSIIFVMCVGTVASAETIDFEDAAIGSQPDRFLFHEAGETSAANWQVTEQDGNHVLAQLDRRSDPKRYSLAIVHRTKIKDVELEIKVRTHRGHCKPQAGVVWRYENSENHLVACIDFEDERVRLYRVARGNRVQIGKGEEIEIESDTWYTLRVEQRGDRIKVYLDGEAFIIEKDDHYDDSGKVGLWTQTDAKTYFDDFCFREPTRRGRVGRGGRRDDCAHPND